MKNCAHITCLIAHHFSNNLYKVICCCARTTHCLSYLPLWVGGKVAWNEWHRLQDQVRNTAAISSELDPSKQASFPNTSSLFAGIVCISNPQSFRQSLIRSSCEICFQAVHPWHLCRRYLTIPPTILPPFFIF